MKPVRSLGAVTHWAKVSYRLAGALAVAAVLAGCGSSALNPAALLPSSTGSVTPPPPKVATATDRTVYVAATAARAHKCGYNFDAVRLKANFLAAEAGRGTPADEQAKLDQAYDIVNRKTLASIGGADYCTNKSTETIKRDLTKVLAGQFDPPKSADPDAVLTGYVKSPDSKFDYETAIGGQEARERKKQSEQ